mmetsp:Transcript_7079/g.635  ORF Transcript_7079/g.635 Transcript_7079/m.635 type:complete len:91 (-) Transcript_7079:95-367(-)
MSSSPHSCSCRTLLQFLYSIFLILKLISLYKTRFRLSNSKSFFRIIFYIFLKLIFNIRICNYFTFLFPFYPSRLRICISVICLTFILTNQ